MQHLLIWNKSSKVMLFSDSNCMIEILNFYIPDDILYKQMMTDLISLYLKNCTLHIHLLFLHYDQRENIDSSLSS